MDTHDEKGTPAADGAPPDAAPTPPTQAPTPTVPDAVIAPSPAPVIPEPAPPPAPETAAAPSAPPAPPPAPTPRWRRWGRRAALGAAVLLALLVLGPWLLSATVLTGLVRSGLGRGEQAGGLGRAQLSWSEGLRLDRILIPSGREESGPRVLLDGVAVEVPLARAAFAAATGGTVPVRVVVGRGRIELELPRDLESGGAVAPTTSDAETTPPETEPAPDGAQEPATLPCGVTAELVVEGLDIAVTLAPPGAAPVRLTLRGLRVEGGAAVQMTTALDLPQGFKVSLDELWLEAPGMLQQPFVVDGGSFVIERLALAAPDAQGGPSPLERLTLVARLVAPRAEAEATLIKDVALTFSIDQGVVELALSGATQGGRLDFKARTTPKDPRRIPASLDLALTDVQVGGVLARALPYVLPLLQATSAPGNGPVAGLPPVTIRGTGALEFLTDEDGSPRLDDSLRTLRARGEVALAPGSLAASRAIDGYARALTGLGVASYLDGIVPTDLSFKGARGTFEVAAGQVTLPGVDLRSDVLDLRVSGQASFDGPYRLELRPLDSRGGEAVKRVLRVIDDAGGIAIVGNLLDGTCEPVLPDADKMGDAARGLPDALRGLSLPRRD